MAEEKQEKKNLSKIKLILKWIGLILLALLISLALIFQAPWKVTALLVIILLACTILPKPYRKWFWLSAGAVVIVLIIWVFLPNKNSNWQPYKYNFEKELAALKTKYEIPDEENAATIYDKLTESYDANDYDAAFLDYNMFDVTCYEPWLSKDYPEAADGLKRNQGTIETLIEISKIEKCIFPISDSMNSSQRLDRLATMRRWAFLLAIAANNDIAEGRTEDCLQKNLALLQMGNHLCQQPETIDWLVGIAIRAIALRQFNRFVISNNPEEAHLKAIEQSLENIKHNWSEDLPRILEDGKLSAKKDLASFYEINPKGKIRLSRDPLAEIRANCRKALQDEKIEYEQLRDAYERIAYPSYFEKKLIKAKTILFWFYIPSPQKAAKIIDSTYEKYYAMSEPDFDWQEETRKSISTIIFNYLRDTTEYWVIVSDPPLPRIHKQHIRHTCDIQGAKIIIALSFYKNKTGDWPESLDEIKSLTPAEVFVDPMNGSSFVYKLTDENFTLYSKGKNNIDENGELDRSSYPQTGADDWLIWPSKLRKTQEEKTDDEQQ